MAECKLRDGRVLGEGYKPYIVAEVNSSHNGNINTAIEMIGEAKRVGCDCVKFQSWSSKTLYSRTYYKANPISERIIEKFAFSKEEQLEIAEYCKEIGISFASTPYSKDEVDFLIEKCNVPYIKIASMDVNNYPYIEYIAKSGVPIVLATGMADFAEIKKAVETVESTKNKNLCLLHCVSIYPAEASIIRLRNMTGLKKNFPEYAVGYSDHSIGTEIAAAAIGLGASMVEKHFTLDKKKIGMDNQMATEPEEFELLVNQCQNVFRALGSEERLIGEEEYKQREKMRRSIIVTRDIKKGERLDEKDLDAKRPGGGIEPGKIKSLIGKRLLTDKEKDTIILMEELDE